MNERQNLRHSQSKVVCGNFLGFWRLTLKNSVSLTDGDVQTFSEGKKKPVYEKKTESYVFSGLNNSISRGRERKSATGRFAIGDLAVYLKYSFFQLGRIRRVRTLQIAN